MPKMADENQNVDTTNTIPDTTVNSEEQKTNEVINEPTLEDRARDQGWKPKEEFEGDSSKWVSAETFVAKGELIDRIESLGKKLKDSEKTIKMLSEHHAKVKESEFNRAIDFLKKQKKDAYETGDVDKIIEIDDKIAETKETQKQQRVLDVAENNNAPHPDFVDWVTENKWYEKNSEMRADADTFGEAYARNNPNKTPKEVLEYVTSKIKRTYKEEFQNQNRNRLSSVEGGGGTRQASSNSDGFILTEDETRIMQNFMRNGVIGIGGALTKEDYIKEIKAMRGTK